MPRYYKKRLPQARHQLQSLPFRTFDDGREICLNNADGRAEYQNRKQQIWAMQRGRCALPDCQKRMSLLDCRLTMGDWEPTGQLRDDRIYGASGKQMNELVHKACLRAWHALKLGDRLGATNESGIQD